MLERMWLLRISESQQELEEALAKAHLAMYQL